MMARPKERTGFGGLTAQQGVERSAAFENRAKLELDKLRVKVAKALEDDFISLFQQGDHSDLTITNEKNELRAHRCIFQARCRHLWQEDWLTSETDAQGNVQQSITLTGMSEKQMSDFIRQLYVVSDSGLLVEEFLQFFPGFKDKCDLTLDESNKEDDNLCDAAVCNEIRIEDIENNDSNECHPSIMLNSDIVSAHYDGKNEADSDNVLPGIGLVHSGSSVGNLIENRLCHDDNVVEKISNTDTIHVDDGRNDQNNSDTNCQSLAERVEESEAESNKGSKTIPENNSISQQENGNRLELNYVTNCENSCCVTPESYSHLNDKLDNTDFCMGMGKSQIEELDKANKTDGKDHCFVDDANENDSAFENGNKKENNDAAGKINVGLEYEGRDDDLGEEHCADETRVVNQIRSENGEDREHLGVVNSSFPDLRDDAINRVGHQNLELAEQIDSAASQSSDIAMISEEKLKGSTEFKLDVSNDDMENNPEIDKVSSIIKSDLSEALRNSYALSIPYETCSALGRDLLQMYLQQNNCNVCLSVDGVKFLAHKCILAARSSYFSAMLGGKWCESEMEEIELQGVSAQAVEQLLLFLYGGVMELCTPSDLMELFIVVDMYGVDSLKFVLEFYVRKDLCHFFHKPCSTCVVSASSALNLCHSFYLEELEERCLKWSVKFFTKIWSNKSFASLPEAVHQKCVRSVLSSMTEKSVLDVIIECDKLSTSLPRIKWTESTLYLTTQLMDSAIEYTSSHFIDVLRAPEFLQWGKVASWKAGSLEEIFNSVIDSLPIDTACSAYQTLVELKAAQTDLEVNDQDVLDLLDSMVKRCEKFLRTHIHQVTRSKQWASVGKTLQSTILENSCYIHLDQLPDPKPKPAKRPLPASLIRPRLSSAPKAAATSSSPSSRPLSTGKTRTTNKVNNSLSQATSQHSKFNTTSASPSVTSSNSSRNPTPSSQRSSFTSVRNHLVSKKTSTPSSSSLSVLSSSAPSSSSRSTSVRQAALSSSSSSSSSTRQILSSSPSSSSFSFNMHSKPAKSSSVTKSSITKPKSSLSSSLSSSPKLKETRPRNLINDKDNKKTSLSPSSPALRKTPVNKTESVAMTSKLPTKTQVKQGDKKQVRDTNDIKFSAQKESLNKSAKKSSSDKNMSTKASMGSCQTENINVKIDENDSNVQNVNVNDNNLSGSFQELCRDSDMGVSSPLNRGENNSVGCSQLQTDNENKDCCVNNSCKLDVFTIKTKCQNVDGDGGISTEDNIKIDLGDSEILNGSGSGKILVTECQRVNGNRDEGFSTEDNIKNDPEDSEILNGSGSGKILVTEGQSVNGNGDEGFSTSTEDNIKNDHGDCENLNESGNCKILVTESQNGSGDNDHGKRLSSDLNVSCHGESKIMNETSDGKEMVRWCQNVLGDGDGNEDLSLKFDNTINGHGDFEIVNGNCNDKATMRDCQNVAGDDDCVEIIECVDNNGDSCQGGIETVNNSGDVNVKHAASGSGSGRMDDNDNDKDIAHCDSCVKDATTGCRNANDSHANDGIGGNVDHGTKYHYCDTFENDLCIAKGTENESQNECGNFDDGDDCFDKAACCHGNTETLNDENH